ncbi:MAG: YkvA family protein [Halioglobus sp.]
MSKDNEYADAYSEKGFWEKLAEFAKKAGYDVVEKALLLFYALQEERTPAWAKATIIGALGYFIAPLDAVIDLTPGIGYTDDLGVLALAVTVVAAYINDTVRNKTAVKMERWFGKGAVKEVDSNDASASGITIEHDPAADNTDTNKRD